MNKPARKLARRYAATLRAYLADGREAVLAEAYELGRQAIADGLGVLDMARIHEQALGNLWPSLLAANGSGRAFAGIETFLLESLSPFEATHRGFCETNRKLQQAVAALERRNGELAEINRALANEIRERKRTERALRESENHLRELFEQAHRMEENLRHLSSRLLHVQEEERKSLSRELHDEVGQALTALNMNLEVLKNNPGGFPLCRQKLTDSQHLLQQTMETVHRFARELRPAMLDELGLLPALRCHLKHFAQRTGLRVSFCANAVAEDLDGERKMVVFRVAQESLTNVAKHAQATRVNVTLRKLKDSICMEVADDGKSFNLGPVNSPQGQQRLGLLGMQERARLVHGTLRIKPQPGKGTIVRVTIPFQTPRGNCARRKPTPAKDRDEAFSPMADRTANPTTEPELT